jgi:hypothetical protein
MHWQKVQHSIRAVLGDAAAAFLVATVIAFVIASLAAAGIIIMGLALTFLILAWAVAVGGSFVLPWQIQYKHRALFGVLLAVMLGVVGSYEVEHYEKPLSKKEISDTIVDYFDQTKVDRSSRLVVQRLEFLPANSQTWVTYNFLFENTGSIVAVGTLDIKGDVISDHILTATEGDKAFSELLAKRDSIKLPTAEIEPNTGKYDSWSIPGVSVKRMSQMRIQKDFLYVLHILIYTDKATPSGKYRITESCHLLLYNGEFARCDQHNRTYLSD